MEDPDAALFVENLRKTGRDTLGFHNEKPYVGFSDERGYFVFYGNLLFNVKRLPLVIGAIIIIGCLSYAIALLLIYLLLSPIKKLKQGVGALEAGDLSYRIPKVGNDELGDLAGGGVNQMAEQIQQTVNDKEQLMLDVSHELKTPITRMKLSLEFLEDEAVQMGMKEDLDEMESKIQELRTSARLDTPYGHPKREKTEIGSFLREIVAKYEKVPPGASLLQAPMPIFVDIDIELFRTACENIMENSIRYSKPDADPVKVWYEKVNKGVNIFFRDHGIGIPQEHLKYVFEPFYRVDKSRDKRTGGYDLGLDLVKKIITAHRGTIAIKSEVGKGTQVTIHFA